MKKIIWLVCAISSMASCGCAFERGHDQPDNHLSPQAQDEQPDYMENNAFLEDPNYPQNH